MSHLISLLIGAIAGAWAASYYWNKHYHGDFWNARKRVLLEELLSQQKKHEVTRTQHELEIDELIDRRIGK